MTQLLPKGPTPKCHPIGGRVSTYGFSGGHKHAVHSTMGELSGARSEELLNLPGRPQVAQDEGREQ